MTRPCVAVIGALLIWIVSGCSALRMADVRARELDPALRAERPKGIRSLDLAMLGRPEVSEDRLEPGDIIDISISDLLQEYQNHSLVTRVGNEGNVSLPLVGLIQLRDLTLTEVEETIRRAYSDKGMLNNPRVVVNLKERRPNRVYVIGGVKNPGLFQLPRGESDLLAAVIAAGGLSEDAGTVVEIRRRSQGDESNASGASLAPLVLPDGASKTNLIRKDADVWKGSSPARGQDQAEHADDVQQVSHLEPYVAQGVHILHYDFSKGDGVAASVAGVLIENGDIVIVERHKKAPIYVLGSVRSPGVYSLPNDRELRVLEAIGEAGGVNPNTTPNKALVIRHHPDGQGVTLVKIDLDTAKKDLEENIILKSGDTVSVEETLASFSRGVVRNAFRVGVGVGAQYNALGPPGSVPY